MRVVFMGTPDFAVPSLQTLYDMGQDVVGVFCQPDRPKGRGNKVEFCPVKQLAVAHGTPVFQPQRIRKDGAEDLAALKPDLCVTAAFGQILSQENLDVPKIGTVNVHASLLPRYRGSAPINWAIIHGETETGVTTMMTDKGMDTGDILLQRAVPIPPEATAGDMTDVLKTTGAELLRETLTLIEQGTCPRIPQDPDKATYDPMLTKELGALDLNWDAQRLDCLIRGVNPWPGAYITLPDGQILKIWTAKPLTGVTEGQPGDFLKADSKDGLVIRTGSDTALEVLQMQMPGGKRMNPKDYLRGHKL
ncbi:MAG: methionyl-tRNA formyltransferase [Clostridia bacterium]|nr:methionyl-tRNA formyltransferase [Clostridia bacterium]